MAEIHNTRIYIPWEPGKRREPLVGPGIPVWSVVGYLKLYDWDVDRVLQAWEGDLAKEDIEAVIEYYTKHRDEVDARLEANAHVP